MNINEAQIDEAWDMHMHYQPFDEETAERIKRHKALVLNNTDDFV